jgi:hypothetical protein
MGQGDELVVGAVPDVVDVQVAASPRLQCEVRPELLFLQWQWRTGGAVLFGKAADGEGTLGPGQNVGPQLDVTGAGGIGLGLVVGRGPDSDDVVRGVGHVVDQLPPRGMVSGRRHGLHGTTRGGQQRVRVRRYMALEQLGAFSATALRNDCCGL